MRVLVWTPPWPMRGSNFQFLRTTYEKHLLVQARTLAQAGHDVTVVKPTAFTGLGSSQFAKLDVIELSSNESVSVLGGANDPSADLYANRLEGEFGSRLADWIGPQLPDHVDVVLLFENPVPFLEALYPNALIVHQMPGSFSRPPYPHTIQFDSSGLFKQSALYGAISRIDDNDTDKGLEGVSAFVENCRSALLATPFISDPAQRGFYGTGRRLLLPLQISNHYAFQTDTPFGDQVSLIHAAIESIGDDDSLIITEYATGPYAEPVCTPDLLKVLREKHPHIVFDTKAGQINSVSQHILPEVDGVFAASSSLAVQGLVWDHDITIVGDTHFAPFDTKRLDTKQKRLLALEYMLRQNQPLSDAVVKDGLFVSRLLEEMHARRNLPLAERGVDFTGIDPDYWERLNRSFRPDRVDRALQRDHGPRRRISVFREFLRKEKPKLVSFDLFDTLILRPVENPADVYALLEWRLNQEGENPPLNFAELRRAAELEARKNVLTEEIQLADIYDQPALAQISDKQRIRFADIEIALEIELCRPRPTGLEFYEVAVQAGHQICITSDMYLPEPCIRAMMDRAGYGKDTSLFLSSAIGGTKKTGALFEHLVEETGHQPSDIVHVGDTANTDIEPAKRLGISSFHLPKSIAYLRDHAQFGRDFPRKQPIESPERSLILGAVSHQLFDDPGKRPHESMFDADPDFFGYAAIGPMLLGFSHWLLAEAKLRNIETLHFLSREGRIFKDAFDIVNRASNGGVASNYLFGSRRAIRVANIKTRADALDVARMTIDASATVGDVLAGRFGLLEQDVPLESLKKAGFSNWNARAGATQVQKDRFAQLVLMLEDVLPRAEIERENYLAYLKSCGLLDERNTGIVDVGWQANMQGALGALIGRPLCGFYLGTLSAARRWSAQGHTVRGYVANFADEENPSPILTNLLLVEHILCAATPRLSACSRRKNRFHPFTRLGKITASVSNTLLRYMTARFSLFATCVRSRGHWT